MMNSIDIKNCPRCHAANITTGRLYGKGANAYIRCEDCGYEIEGDNLMTLAPTWNISKEEHVTYVPSILRKHGNCFIAQNVIDVWKGYDLAEYLSQQTEVSVIIRECNYMREGAVAEMRLH